MRSSVSPPPSPAAELEKREGSPDAPNKVSSYIENGGVPQGLPVQEEQFQQPQKRDSMASQNRRSSGVADSLSKQQLNHYAYNKKRAYTKQVTAPVLQQQQIPIVPGSTGSSPKLVPVNRKGSQSNKVGSTKTSHQKLGSHSPAVGGGQEAMMKTQYIQQFGALKGQQYYGAIRELEEFLDPNVLMDDDFKLNQKTMEDLNSVEGRLNDQSNGRLPGKQVGVLSEGIVDAGHGQQMPIKPVLQGGTQQFPSKSTRDRPNSRQLGQGSFPSHNSRSASRSKPNLKKPTPPSSTRNYGRGQGQDAVQEYYQGSLNYSYKGYQGAPEDNEGLLMKSSYDQSNGAQQQNLDTLGKGPSTPNQNVLNSMDFKPKPFRQGYTEAQAQQVAQRLMKNPLHLGPVVRGGKRSGPTRTSQKPKSKAGTRKRPAGLADDMFLMNLRMQMSTQGKSRGSEHHTFHQVGMPLMAHTYGYNDSNGELRSTHPNGVFSQHQSNSRQKLEKPGHNLIFDPQNPQNPSYQISPHSGDGFETQLNQNPATPQSSVFGKQRRSNNGDDRFAWNLGKNSTKASLQGKTRHRSVNQRQYHTNFSTRSNFLSQNKSGLPEIQPKPSQMTSITKITEGGIDSQGKMEKTAKLQNLRVGDTHPSEFSNDDTSIDYKLSQQLQQDSIISNMNQMQGGTKQFKGVAVNYQYTQEDRKAMYQNMRNGKRPPQKMTNFPTPSGGSKGEASGGKIILKKINHFFDNDKINKLYKNDMRKMNPQFTDIHIAKNQAKLNKMMYKHFAAETGADFRADKHLRGSKKKGVSAKKVPGLIDIVDQQRQLDGVSPDGLIEGSVARTEDRGVSRHRSKRSRDKSSERPPASQKSKKRVQDQSHPMQPIDESNQAAQYPMTDGQSKTGYPLSYKEVTHSEDRESPRKPQGLNTVSRDKSKGSGGKSSISREMDGDLAGKTKLESTRINRKGFQTAPKNMKRPQIPPVPLNYTQQMPASAAKQSPFESNYAHLSKKQQRDWLNYINEGKVVEMESQKSANMAVLGKKGLKMGEHIAIHNSNQPIVDQYNRAIDKHFESTGPPPRKVKVSKQKKKEAPPRNKSAPKRRIQRQQEVLKSLPNKVMANRLRGVTQDRKFADDEQILNIQIQKPKKNTSSDGGSHVVSVSHPNFEKTASKTYGHLKSTKLQTVNTKKRGKNKSPNQHLYNSGQFIFNEVKGSHRHHDTINSHRSIAYHQRTGGFRRGQPSTSSVYKQRNARNQSPSRSKSINSKKSRIQSCISHKSAVSQLSNVRSEVSRALNHVKSKKKRTLILDRDHLAKLKDPENIRDRSLYVPEGYSTDHRRDLEVYSLKSKKKKKSDQLDSPMRSQSAQGVMKKALTYKFQLKDLNKYSSKLQPKDINWKIKLSALGKKIPDVKERKKILVKGSHFNTLLKLQQQTDWSRTPVYHQFLRNGRWKHEDDQIYSEIELQYHISYINKFVSQENAEEINENEAESILQKYFDKTMHTLEVLMNQLNMMYYWEKVRLMFVDLDPTLVHLQKLMSRCLKLYRKIDSFIKIFKLIQKKEQFDELGQQNLTILQRLRVTIKLLLKENPILPNQFNFKGIDLLDAIKKEQKMLGVDTTIDQNQTPSRERNLDLNKNHSTDSKFLAMSPDTAGKYHDKFEMDSFYQDSVINVK